MSELNEFSDWLSSAATEIPIFLNIKKSRFVPNGVRGEFIGLPRVLQEYCWNSADWTTTRSKVSQLREQLDIALSNNDEEGTLLACKEILEWGGDRNSKRGALPFLTQKAKENELSSYIKRCKMALSLELATQETIQKVERMNSMLTKIHAFASADGLPIYDTRVACATACLVELFRRATQPNNNRLPDDLKFPAISVKRKATLAFPGAPSSGLIDRANPDATRWTWAKIRLGRVLKYTLTKNPDLFADQGELTKRMHAMEASLFMAGYSSRSFCQCRCDQAASFARGS